MKIDRTTFRVGFIVLVPMLIAPGAHAKKTINVWIPWGGERIAAFEKVASQYEKNHPGIEIKFSSYGGDYTRFVTASAAGTPPDVHAVNGPQIAEYADTDLLAPLKSYFSISHLELNDFFYPAWHQLYYKNEIWALPFETNPCFAFAWNKQVFAESGLDENKPPATIEEIDAITAKVTKTDNNGNYTRFGFMPPSGTYTYANTIFNWGWIFGGSFYSEEKKNFTCDNPKVVKALTWLVGIAKKYDFNKITAAGATDVNQFYTGKVAMATVVPNLILSDSVLKKAKANLRYGVTSQQPYPEGGIKGVSYDGGWTLAISKGSKNKKEAWDFIKWFLTSDEATMMQYKSIGLLTGYRKSQVFKAVKKDEPDWGPTAVEVLENAKFGRPVTPATQFFVNEMNAQIPLAFTLKKSPQQTLEDANRNINKELAKRLKRRR